MVSETTVLRKIRKLLKMRGRRLERAENGYFIYNPPGFYSGRSARDHLLCLHPVIETLAVLEETEIPPSDEGLKLARQLLDLRYELPCCKMITCVVCETEQPVSQFLSEKLWYGARCQPGQESWCDYCRSDFQNLRRKAAWRGEKLTAEEALPRLRASYLARLGGSDNGHHRECA